MAEKREDGRWKPVEFPSKIEEMMDAWQSYAGPSVGWCLLCNSAIRTAADMLPGSNTHNCPQGRALEQTK